MSLYGPLFLNPSPIFCLTCSTRAYVGNFSGSPTKSQTFRSGAGRSFASPPRLAIFVSSSALAASVLTRVWGLTALFTMAYLLSAAPVLSLLDILFIMLLNSVLIDASSAPRSVSCAPHSGYKGISLAIKRLNRLHVPLAGNCTCRRGSPLQG